MTVTAYDAFGNVATGFTGSVNVSVASGAAGGILGGTTSVAAVGGVATFSGLTLTKAASGYWFQVSSGGLIAATAMAVSVSPAAAAQLVVTSQPPGNVNAGTSFGLTVLAEDRFGNWTPGWNGNVAVALASNPAGGTLGGTLSVLAGGGVASFSGLSINRAGAGYTLQVNGGGLMSVTTTAMTVNPGAAVTFVITAQPPGSVIVGAGFQVTVTAKDLLGNPATSFSGRVTIALVAHAGKGRLAGTFNTTAINGVATFSSLKVTAIGRGYRLIVRASGLPFATSNPFNVTVAPRTLVRARVAHAVLVRKR